MPEQEDRPVEPGSPEKAGEPASWLPGAAVVAVVVQLLGLYLPGSPEVGFALPGADKVAHFLIFAVPVWLLGRLTGRIWPVVAVFAAHAVLSEFVQGWFVPYRESDPWDVVADLAGITAAAWLLLRQRRRSERASA